MTHETPSAMIVDNGSGSTGLIGRLLRGAGWVTTTCPHTDVPQIVPPVNAVVLTGTDRPVWEQGYEQEMALIRSCPVPLLGLCGGMQLIGRTFGVGVVPVPTAVGRSKVRLNLAEPLFAGMPQEVQLFQRHVYGLARSPDGFELIASSDACPAEGIRHRRRHLYGMQAHLEFREEGRRILRRFLALAAGLPATTWRIGPPAFRR